jgi:hypothetical protein
MTRVIDYLAAYLTQEEEKAASHRRKVAPKATTTARKSAAKHGRMKTMLNDLLAEQPQPVDFLAFGD